ncbi:MAG: hypothetical protein PHS86_10230, partial [Syntrophaceae bacterium]|nr:hypothetical protein [Syntrophaceae bacterium]
EIYFAVFSDHGMTTLTEVVDVKKPVDQLGYKFGKDYAAVYDSTMVRLWFFNHSAKQAILETLDKTPHCNVLNDEELKRYSIDFPDNMYGEKIVLMDPGFQIAPSDMGLKALPGMHGFAPEHEDSFAAFLSSEKVDIELKCVDDYFRVMTQRMDML